MDKALKKDYNEIGTNHTQFTVVVTYSSFYAQLVHEQSNTDSKLKSLNIWIKVEYIFDSYNMSGHELEFFSNSKK